MPDFTNETPFDETDNRLQIAQGYYELGMIEDAWTELEVAEQEMPENPLALQLRILLLLKERKWDKALELASQLRASDPHDGSGYIHGAFCLHEMQQTQAAIALLESAPEHLRNEAIFFYNLGCYRSALGELTSARECLRRSFDLDQRLLDIARKDPDLESLRDAI